MFHIDGTPCDGKGCTASWCTATEPMTMADISRQIARTAEQQGWMPRPKR